MEQTFVLRVLPPFTANIKKRLIKSPKVYIRDSGLLHSLLEIETMDDLFGHPIYGPSYEGMVIENIVSQLPRWQASFFRTASGAEIDLILSKGRKTIAIEIKSSTSPRLSRSFWNSIDSIQPDEALIIAPVDEEYPIDKKIMVKPLHQFIEKIVSNRQ